MALQFEWEEDKAALNIRKHGVSFDEASTVFVDPLAVIFDDEEHSDDEMREIVIGHTITSETGVGVLHRTWRGFDSDH